MATPKATGDSNRTRAAKSMPAEFASPERLAHKFIVNGKEDVYALGVISLKCFFDQDLKFNKKNFK